MRASFYDLDLHLKSRLGKIAYWQGGFRQLSRPIAHFPIEVNGHRHVASFALITRVRNYGGDFQIAKRVKLTDGDFEVVIFENQAWHDYLRFFAAVVVNRLYKTNGVTIYRAKEAVVGPADSDRVYVQTDGEAIGNVPRQHFHDSRCPYAPDSEALR